eukprot:scaffold99857_cov27-Tisochrysis_lutea.AAC.4
MCPSPLLARRAALAESGMSLPQGVRVVGAHVSCSFSPHNHQPIRDRVGSSPIQRGESRRRVRRALRTTPFPAATVRPMWMARARAQACWRAESPQGY